MDQAPSERGVAGLLTFRPYIVAVRSWGRVERGSVANDRGKATGVLASTAFWWVLAPTFLLLFTWPFLDFDGDWNVVGAFRFAFSAWVALIVILALVSTRLGKEPDDV